MHWMRDLAIVLAMLCSGINLLLLLLLLKNMDLLVGLTHEIEAGVEGDERWSLDRATE